MHYPVAGGGNPSFGPHEVIGFLRRRAVLILSVFVVITGLVAAWTYSLPRSYESSASFLVETLAGLDPTGPRQTTETESELLLGRRVIEPVVDSMDLHLAFIEGYEAPPAEVFTFVDAGRDAEAGRYTIAPSDGRYVVREYETGERLASAAPGEVLAFAGIRLGVPRAEWLEPATLEVMPFAKAVAVTAGRLAASSSSRQSVVMRLTCAGDSPESAHSLCAAIQKSYLELRREIQRAEAVTASQFLVGQVDGAKLQLAEAEDSLRAYRGRTGAIALDEQAGQGVIQAAQLQATRRELSAEREALSTLIEEIQAGSGHQRYRQLASFPTFLQSRDLVATLMQSLVELDNRRTELAVRRTTEDPELASLDGRIAEIEDQLLVFAQSYRTSLSAQISSIDGNIRDQSMDLSRLPAQQLETARLQRRVDVLEDFYRYLETRLREAEVAEAIALPSVSVVDSASLPYEPAWPNVPLNLAMGLFLGASTGVLGGLLREYTDQKVRGRGDVLEWGLPVLSMVPRVPPKILPKLATVSERTLGPGTVRRSSAETLYVLQESFRSLAFELEAAGDRISAAGLRSVAISSACRGDGKTFCASSLAIQSAIRGQRTLLIDADVRAQGVTRWFHLRPDSPGLSDLMGRAGDPWDETVRMIRSIDLADGSTPRPDPRRSPGAPRVLDVLPSGREASTSPRMVTATLRRILDAAAQRYDLVIIDTPPVAVASDAAQVASQVDGVIVVVRAGATDRPALVHALDHLNRIGGDVLGLVLNEVEVPHYYQSYAAPHS